MKWSREASQASGEEKLEKREAFFMGLGDAVIPTVLVISANTFLNAPMFGLINIPALGAAIGTLAGYVGLMLLVLRGKPQAGLPFLNSGAIVGLLIASYLVGVKPF